MTDRGALEALDLYFRETAPLLDAMELGATEAPWDFEEPLD